ncbi:MAG: OmpA family protein [Planctomycetes bacterium]|nr:OmpA family protein [Planctomycetota bacterium]
MSGEHGKPDEHGAHGAHAEGHAAEAGHEEHKKHKVHEHDAPPGVPPWLISFGDMMTLFLCFFIVLVTMAPKQDAGLIAAGMGPFIAAMENKGQDLPMTGAESLSKINEVRKRFGLMPTTEQELLLGAVEVKSAKDIETLIKRALRPYAEMRQPFFAVFREDSDALSDEAKSYLDALAESFRPGHGQILVLEGHAADAGTNFQGDNARLAAARAQAVKTYLCEELGFVTTRVEARAPAVEMEKQDAERMRRVDARLMQPAEKPEK